MAAYLIVDTLLSDANLYEEYKSKARPMIEKFGGEYLARGGRMTLRETEVWLPTRLVLAKFPDVETANRCLDSFEYQQTSPSARKRRVEQRSSLRASKNMTDTSGQDREPRRFLISHHRHLPRVASIDVGQRIRIVCSSAERAI